MTNSASSSSIAGTAPVPLVTTTNAADQVTLPLTQGLLTTNLGIPIAIVCCKVIVEKGYIQGLMILTSC
jgi:dynein light intermediate chain 1